MKLTARNIPRLTVEDGSRDRLIFDDEQRGLAVRVTASGGRTYLCQYTLNGQKYRVPLGSCSAVSLADARKAASAVMGAVAQGKNPAMERKEAAKRAQIARDRLTLEGLIASWERLHLAHRRPRYASEAVRALKYGFERYLGRPADDLDRATVVKILDGISHGKKPKRHIGSGAAMASRTAAYGRALYSWGLKRGAVEKNPFADLPALASPAKRERVLSDDELARIWRAADRVTLPYGKIVQLLMLTGQRRDEVAGMTWAEVSDDLKTWIIPGTRTKNGVPHVVPLNALAQGLIKSLLPGDPKETQTIHERRRDHSNLVLPGEMGTFGGWSKSKAGLDKACGVTDWRIHDLRRTVATGLQRLGVRLEVTEAVLNHISGSRAGIVGIYQRHDWQNEKTAALRAWGEHLARISGARMVTNLVPFVRDAAATGRNR